MPPGTYTVSFVLPGFATVVQEGLELRVGQTARLTATLKVAQRRGDGERRRRGVARRRLQDRLVDQHRPRADRVAARWPTATSSGSPSSRPACSASAAAYRFISDGPVIGAGGNASQSTILVDGVDFTDPTLGLARARFSQDAISEFRVIANRFDTEIGGSAGGALSIVTKSGTNDDARARRSASSATTALRAKGKLETQKNDYSRQQFGFTLGGPIVKDRTHFFGSFEQINEDAITLFRPGGAYASLAADIEVPLTRRSSSPASITASPTSQNLRLKFVYEHYRRRTSASAASRMRRAAQTEARQLELHAAPTPGRSATRTLNQLARPGRTPQVRGAEQLDGAVRVLLERQHADDRRQHRRRPGRHGRHQSSCATPFFTPRRQRAMGRTTSSSAAPGST